MLVTFDILDRIPLAAPTIDTFVFIDPVVAVVAGVGFDGSPTVSSVQTSP